MEDGDEERCVTLFSQFGKVFVWNPEDAKTIRVKYRIVGSLIGSLPRKPKQNHCFSLPLLLSQAEATLLKDKGLATIFDLPEHLPAPSNEEVETFNELRHDSVVKQIELFEREREEKQVELAEIIEEGRKRKRKLREKDKGLTKPVKKVKSKDFLQGEISEELCQKQEKVDICLETKWNIENGFTVNEEATNKTDCAEASLATSCIENAANELECKHKDISSLQRMSPDLIDYEEKKSLSALGTLIHIPTIMPSQRLQAFSVARWTYPYTETEKLHYKVFLDLWAKGYYLTSGVKFGGDLLAYPGDPMRYHSFYIVIIVPWGKKMTPFEMISAGRLGATVKKTALLCSVNDETDEILYTSINWSGIS